MPTEFQSEGHQCNVLFIGLKCLKHKYGTDQQINILNSYYTMRDAILNGLRYLREYIYTQNLFPDLLAVSTKKSCRLRHFHVIGCQVQG